MAFNLSLDEFNRAIADKGSAVVFKKKSCDVVTPVLAALKLFEKFPDHHFLFESAEKGNNKGRFSVIGLMPDLVWKSKGGESFINGDFENNPADFSQENGDVLSNLRQLIARSKIDWSGLEYGANALPAVCGGIFGFMSYDMGRLMENLPSRDLADVIGIEDSIFIRPQIIIVFDNLFDCALICAPVFADKKTSYEEIKSKILEIENILDESFADRKIKAPARFEFSSNFTQKEYCDTVIAAKKYITDGDIFQVLPSQRFTANFPEDLSAFDFYRSLRRVNPSPFLFYLKLPNFVLTGSSPEIMVSCKDQKVTIRPLAGTRKRGKNSAEDKKIATELLADEKEVAEHLMLIDLGRHDVGRVCKEGSVVVTEKMIVENYSHVMHISSNVEGILREDKDALDALVSGFPAGTVSGAPKIRAMEIIEELEKEKRSFYAGCVGYFAGNGDMETCITLRSALIKDGKIYLQAGAGVVFDSDPQSEYQECVNKAQALIKACELIGDF